LIHRRDKLRAVPLLQERAFANDKIEFIWDSVVTDIKGGLTNVEKIIVKNLKTNESRELFVDGCFIWVGIRPNTEFLTKEVKLDQNGFISVNSNMETTVAGVYAVGDVRNTPLRQVVTAAGDAAIAAFSAQHYIESINK
jgi:thioredoxin reductase (NADPH)